MAMTPFELTLSRELEIEVQKFGADWLFKWHEMTHEGGATDIDDFKGGRIHYTGIEFGDQQQQIFWQAIRRYLKQKAHEAFVQWNKTTEQYPPKERRSSLEG